MGVTLQFKRLEPFGVEIDRDLAEPFGPSEAYHFKELFAQHGLLLARGQNLTMERQREICALLGPILLREGETGYMSNEGGGYAAVELGWHSDAAYTEHPFDALSLHALDVIDDASTTRFVSAEDAFDRLDPTLRERLEGQDQDMISPHFDSLAEWTCDVPDPAAMKQGVFPAVFTNPHNGRKCVWVSQMQTARLRSMDWEESRRLLHEAFECLYDENCIFEHRWRKGDIIIWDNIAVQHARGNIEEVGPRLLQRVIVGTEGVAPFIEAA